MTPLRSFLFIPADSDKKLGKADGAGADALILDLEDAVSPENKAMARERLGAFLAERPPGRRTSELWVRVNPFDTGLTLQDLVAVVRHAPDGLMAPKCDGPQDLLRLSHYLDALEAESGVAPGSIRLMPVATETAIAPFRLGDYATAGLSRLAAMTWGAEDLATAIGAATNRDASGDWALTYRMVRSLLLLGAHAAGVQAVDTLYADFRDTAGLREASKASRAEGFTGRVAIHPGQVAPINESYRPQPDEIAHAERVLAAFAAEPGAGAVGLDGKMIDIPHLKQARKVLAQAEMFRCRDQA